MHRWAASVAKTGDRSEPDCHAKKLLSMPRNAMSGLDWSPIGALASHHRDRNGIGKA
jgi:hypothetical protein